MSAGVGSRRATARGRRRHPLRARLRYSFDNALSRGPIAVIGWLGAITLAVVLVAAAVEVVLHVLGIESFPSFREAAWQAMLRLLDPGTFSGDEGWANRLVGLFATLSGIFIAGSLIGLIANSVDQRVESLRKGRSAVLEDDHTLILGWSDRVAVVLKELVIANESEKSAAVVVLAGEDKMVMEDTLRDEVGDLRSTRLVCRNGSTSSAADLELVNLAGARSVIAVGGDDAEVVKSVLAISLLRQAAGGGGPHPPVVAEINDPDTAASVRSLFGDEVVVVTSDAVVAELTAQACRQRGLSAVFRDLLDFDGDEIYFAPFASLVGRTYGYAQLSFDRCSLMGIFSGGEVLLNPPADRVIGPDDELIAVAADDSTFVVTGHRPPPTRIDPPPVGVRDQQDVAQLVLVGWSHLGPRVVAELDSFLGAGSRMQILVDADRFEPDEVRATLPDGVAMQVEVATYRGGPEKVVHTALDTDFDEVIVLGCRDGMSVADADADTLLTLLAFERIRRGRGLARVRIVAELLDPRNAALAKATGADDFIISDELASLMIAQLSERPDLDRLFQDLFDPEGSTIEVIAASRYGVQQATCFADVVAAVSEQGHSAIGYRRDADGSVLVNPPKSEPLRLEPEDGIVVVR